MITINSTGLSNNGTLTQKGVSTFTGAITANGGVVGNLTGNVTGNVTSTGITINTSAITNNSTLAQVGTSTFTGAITANGGITSNGLKSYITASNSYYVGGNNNTFDSTVISVPKVYNGIASGSGDGADFLTFNTASMSWHGTGFVDACNLACNAVINHRTGDFLTNGAITADGGFVGNVTGSLSPPNSSG